MSRPSRNTFVLIACLAISCVALSACKTTEEAAESGQVSPGTLSSCTDCSQKKATGGKEQCGDCDPAKASSGCCKTK